MILHAVLLLSQSALAADKVVAVKTFPAKSVTRIVARVEAGRIKVRAKTGSELRVEAVKPADSEGHCDLRLHLDRGTLELFARKPQGKDDVCDGGFVIEAPAGATLEAQSGSGDIEASGLSKPVRLRAGSGSIRLKDVLGQIYAVTGSGDITAQLKSAAFDARTGSGNVRVTLAKASGLVSARTGSGRVDVGLPAGSKLRLRAKTGSGKIVNALPDDPKAALVVEASTGSGDVSISAAK